MTAKKNISTRLASQMITMLCGLVIPRLLLRAYGSETYGITVSVAQLLSYVTLLEGGIGGVARAELYAPLAGKDQARISSVYHGVRHFFRNVALVYLGYSAALGIFFKEIAHVSAFSRGYLFALVMSISVASLGKYMSGLADLTLISADKKNYVNNIVVIITTLANAAVVSVTIALGWDIMAVKLLSSAVFLLRPVFYAAYVKKHYRIDRNGVQKAELKQKYSGIGQHIAYFLHTNMDIVLLTIFADARLVAVYSVYNMVIGNIRAIAEAFSNGMEAEFGEMIARGNQVQLRCAVRKYQRLIAAATTVLFGCAGILIVPFVRLYTAGIEDAQYIQPLFALILLLAEALNCLMIPYSALPVASNRIRQTQWGAYAEAALNLVCSLVLMQYHPLLGAAAGTLIATVFRSVYYLSDAGKNVLHACPGKLVFSVLLQCAILTAVVLAGRRLIAHAEIHDFLSWALCGAAAFGCLSLMAAAGYKGTSE